MIILGAHLSISGGYPKALERIIQIGGNCLQMFSSSPRGWSFAKIPDQEIIKFYSLKSRLNIDPVYFHASYLINLANDGKIGHLSKLSLISELVIAPRLKIKGSIIHLGSFKNLKTKKNYQILITHIKEVLDKTPMNSLFVIENAGTRKIGCSLDEIAQIMKDLNNDRVRVCLDTCHLHATGYDLTSYKKLESFLSSFDKKIGLNKLEAWHLNDSRDPFASYRDRHENISKGYVGIKVFRYLLNHPKTKKLPFIIETPGFDKKGPDKENLDILKSLINK